MRPNNSLIDFNNCETDIFRTYDGKNGNKICINYKNEKYMLKFPPATKSNKDISYSNGCICEYLGSHIYQTLGIPTQETLLGVYTIKGKEKLVVACKDFVKTGEQLISFARVKNSCLNCDSSGFGVELKTVLEAIEEQNLLNTIIVKERFWDMFAADALLGNFDRHNGNWGFLINEEKKTVSLAPVYDNGSCLYPQLSEEQMKAIINTPEEIEKRLYVFPNSALKIEGKKINYLKLYQETTNRQAIQSFIKVYNNIDMDKIMNIIMDAPITDIQKQFYSTMINERFENIMMKSYNAIISKTQTLSPLEITQEKEEEEEWEL
ncbi:HipA domain-containing protein [Eggerthia catenaformis]